MPIYMCTRLIFIALILLSALAEVSCRRPQEMTSHDEFGAGIQFAKSFKELTNSFGTNFVRPFVIDIHENEHCRFALFTRWPWAGIKSFEVFCYENTTNEIWELRSANFFNISDSMKVTPVLTNETLILVHDGLPLFSIRSAAKQLAWQAQSIVVRKETKPPYAVHQAGSIVP
jgi:hypothetical protein